MGAARTAPFRVMLRMEVKPGLERAFEDAWVSGAAAIDAEAANLGQWLSKSADEEAVYFIVSDWTDEASFRAYEQTDRHSEHRTRLHPFRVRGSMSVSHVLHQLPRPDVSQA